MSARHARSTDISCGHGVSFCPDARRKRLSNGVHNIYYGPAPAHKSNHPTSGGYVTLWGEAFYRIAHHDQIPPFFISLVSSADHWLFIASNGGLTAGRVNAESALFPYETEDKIMANREHTGGKTVIFAKHNGRLKLWEPLSDRHAGIYQIERHLYKNVYGDKIVFEEVNLDLGLRIRIAWRTSDRFGFIRTCELENLGAAACEIRLLDGLQNILPYGATVQLQTNMSNLLNAYKRNEWVAETGLAIFALSATLTDRPEPSESLRATVVWQTGLDVQAQLLSSEQITAFRQGNTLTSEYDVCGRAGAYLVASTFPLAAGSSKRWHSVADVNYDAADIVQLNRWLSETDGQIEMVLEAEIADSTATLKRYVAAADGLQYSGQATVSAHHYANTLFNIMRGGIFPTGLRLSKSDLLAFFHRRDRTQLVQHREWFAALPAEIDIQTLRHRASETEDQAIVRLCLEYLPLTFSRRHGDPSRPWNQFSINLKHTDGSPRLDFQGNWRDIFQNWEPLMLAFPDFLPNVLARFLNATTADGYNPYRVTRDGVEWEVPEPHNPWSNIGYWSDHQIIYLQKMLELVEQVDASSWSQLANFPIFAYADVPYRLHSYQEMLNDWYNTISFDWDLEQQISERSARMGTDGRLLHDAEGNIVYATLTEKLLTLLLAKVTNLVPEGGIWMNTQRPEWNDANNALVGKGLSVVTTAYLRRFVAFWLEQLRQSEVEHYPVNRAIADLFQSIESVLTQFAAALTTGFDDHNRRQFMDDLGGLATIYRRQIYEGGVPAAQVTLAKDELQAFLELVQRYVEQTLQANKRSDGLYHAYNILRLGADSVAVDNLYLMLEGQVAILSSGLLGPEEAVALLQALRASDLYRADQHSYMLYPNRRLPGFLEKNNIPEYKLKDSKLARAMALAGDKRLLVQDVAGSFHFNGAFRNANDVGAVLNQLEEEPEYTNQVKSERSFLLALFEEVFVHQSFTGRSGTFFAYEGLGSIYWHMVAKLLLATQELYLQAEADGVDPSLLQALAAAYRDIRQGIGYKRSPASYGAFPTDPYSHTPMNSGARQPGMTGQVKEEILTRWGELGVILEQGRLQFRPTLLELDEFSEESVAFEYVDVKGQFQSMMLPANSLAFTYCQTPIIYTLDEDTTVHIKHQDGTIETTQETQLTRQISQAIYQRDGTVKSVSITVPRQQLQTR